MQFPNEFIKASSCLITSKTFTELTSYGMNDEVGKRGNPHKWVIDFATRKLRHRPARALQAFIDSLDGRYNTFTLDCPLPFMGDTESFLVRVSALAGSNTVSVKNLPASKSEALIAGDFINFSNHDKTYKIVNTVSSSGSGIATMTIHPRLKSNIAANNSVTKGVFTLRLTSDSSSLELKGGEPHNIIKISASEA